MEKTDFNLIQPFCGNTEKEDAKLWLTRFQLFANTKGLTANKAKSTLPLFFKENALRWYISLPDNVKDDFDSLKDAFLNRYGPDERTKWKRTAALYQLQQGIHQSVEDFITLVMAQAADVDLQEDQIQVIVLNGLKPNIRQFVIQKQYRDLDELRTTAKLGEMTTTDQSKQHEELVGAISRLEEKFQAMTAQINAAQEPNVVHDVKCQYCGLNANHRNCPAYGKNCLNCGKMNHFARRCRSAKRTQQQLSQ